MDGGTWKLFSATLVREVGSMIEKVLDVSKALRPQTVFPVGTCCAAHTQPTFTYELTPKRNLTTANDTYAQQACQGFVV
jgi:hypothetical protein